MVEQNIETREPSYLPPPDLDDDFDEEEETPDELADTVDVDQRKSRQDSELTRAAQEGIDDWARAVKEEPELFGLPAKKKSVEVESREPEPEKKEQSVERKIEEPIPIEEESSSADKEALRKMKECTPGQLREFRETMKLHQQTKQAGEKKPRKFFTRVFKGVKEGWLRIRYGSKVEQGIKGFAEEVGIGIEQYIAGRPQRMNKDYLYGYTKKYFSDQPDMKLRMFAGAMMKKLENKRENKEPMTSRDYTLLARNIFGKE